MPIKFATLSVTDTIFAQVLLPLPVPLNYTYRVPQEWNDFIQIGQRVVVQFGVKKIYAGIVVDFSDVPPEKYEASYIIEILDDEPLITPSQLKFWQWIASYYMCYTGDVMAAALPAGFRLQSESVLVLNPEFDETQELEMDEKEWLILAALHKKKELKIEQAAEAVGLKSPMKYIKSLYQRGIILMHEEVKENYRPKMETFVCLTPEWSDEEFARSTLDKLEKRAPKQVAAIMAIMGLGKGEFALKSLQEKFDIASSHIQALEEKGLLLRVKKEVGRITKNRGGNADFELTELQKKCVNEVQSAFDSQKNVLLHGITGSGKTFVYMHFIKEALKKGKQVLYLLPEVGITEQLVTRLAEYFGAEMGVWHHYYSAHERTELYTKVRSGEIKLLVGARSALFAPFGKLGLIVVDEEHENTFKQFDRRPHYHGRDAALQLAALNKCSVLLGSATPSYEMLQLCRDGKMALTKLQKRFKDVLEPEIELIHTGEAKRQNRMKMAFSARLLEEMLRVLDAKGQIIVFQNRKGYVPFISCDLCGFTAHCINCDITLTYYKSINAQKCNYCGYSQDPVSKCPACGSADMNMKGFGTERIAEELAIYFPEARISRFDQDSIKKRHDFQKIFTGFEKGDIDILVGTQLLSKGLDFLNVGLVAVVDADMLLNIPDFRSHERAYQLMHQVAGRAGRGTYRGKAMIQTAQINHPVIQAVVSGAYYELAEMEMPMRLEHGYPPFTRLIRIQIRHKDYQLAKEAAFQYSQMIRKALHDRVLGPQMPPVGKIRNYHLQNIQIKMDPKNDNIKGIKNFLLKSANDLSSSGKIKGIVFDFDVDPV